MYAPDLYVGLIVGLLCVAGIVLSVWSIRQRSRMRRRWEGEPAGYHPLSKPSTVAGTASKK
jgi:hypothetical protein